MSTTDKSTELAPAETTPENDAAIVPTEASENLETIDLDDDNSKSASTAESIQNSSVETSSTTGFVPALPTLVIDNISEDSSPSTNITTTENNNNSTHINSADTSTSTLSHKPSASNVSDTVSRSTTNVEDEEDESSLTVSKPRRSKRSLSFALSMSNINTTGQQTVSSIVLFKNAFESISKHKAVSKNPTLQSSVNRALSMYLKVLISSSWYVCTYKSFSTN